MKFETIDQENLSWSAAVESSVILNDSFRDDFIRSEYWPQRYDMRQLLQVKTHEQLMKFPEFRTVVKHFARLIYITIRRNPNTYLMIMKDDSPGCYNKPMGMALLTLPAYIETATSSYFYRLKTWFISLIFKIQDCWEFKMFSNPLHSREMKAEFDLGTKECGGSAPSQEQIEYLESLSHDELAKQPYPKTYSYYLSLLAVCNNEQGKGVGRKLVDQVITTLRNDIGIQSAPIGGPAKLQLFSSPAGLNFYKRYGFTLGSSYASKQKSGRILYHSFFFMNLT